MLESGTEAWVQIAAATLSGNSLGQTVHTLRASVHRAAKLVAALLRVARVPAGEALTSAANHYATNQWCIAKNGGGYTQTGVAKGLKAPCLFMIAEVNTRCQKNPYVGIRTEA